MMLNRFHAFTIMMFSVMNEALAQATPPATSGSPAAPEPADDGIGASWLWIIIGLAIIAGLVWYFMRGRSRTTTADTTGPSATSGTPTSHPKVFDNDKRK
jgi:bacteriorhodopsin